MDASVPTGHVRVASELQARLHEPIRYTNDRPETMLDGHDATAIATAALAHGVLALVEEVARLSG